MSKLDDHPTVMGGRERERHHILVSVRPVKTWSRVSIASVVPGCCVITMPRANKLDYSNYSQEDHKIMFVQTQEPVRRYQAEV